MPDTIKSAREVRRMEEDKSIYISINHLDDYLRVMNLRVGDILALKKEPDNLYDDEAIAVYTKENCKCGYVANSVSTVARGTFSAGRVYDQIGDKTKCIVSFVMEEEGTAIAKVVR